VTAGALVLCEAASATGLGHLVRSLALVAELVRRGEPVQVALREDAVPDAADRVRAAGAEPVTGSWEDLADAVAGRPGRARSVVVDSYRTDHVFLRSLHRSCRTSGSTLLVMEDTGRLDPPADVVLNSSAALPPPRYGAPLVLRGPRFALLRPEFARLREEALATVSLLPEVPAEVLVVFGGSDVAGRAGLAAQAAAAAFPRARVRVVTSRPPRDLPANVEVLGPRARIWEDFQRADLVVTAAGSTVFELCCLARPAAALAVADNQVPNYDALVSAGQMIGLGRSPEAPVEELISNLRGATTGRGALRAIAAAASTVTDGLGAARVAEALTGARAVDDRR